MAQGSIPIPTVAQVEAIAAQTDPIIRNLHITLCYHQLAQAIAARTGLQANWCTFATWASKQAGQTIRHEDFRRTLEILLNRQPTAMQVMPDVIASTQALGVRAQPDAIQESVSEILNPLAAFQNASHAVGQGNKKVFEEIGREFARFIEHCLSDPVYTPEHIASFCAALRPGDPPDGQDYLRRAFTRYYQACFEPDSKMRAELMLLANIEIGCHEQTRLQPEITAAMNAAIIDYRDFRRRLIKALFPDHGWLARLRLFLLDLIDRRRPFDRLVDLLLAESRRQARMVITEYIMTITLPDNIALRLGEDIPAEFPPALRHITLPELHAFLERIDLTPDSTIGSGAQDWANLPNRLHFIADFFRCYHQSSQLFHPPFTPQQIEALHSGRLPQGRL